MKMKIVLFVIFAFAYSSEAAKLRIRVKNFFEEKTPINGQIDLTLHGKTSERHIIFNQTFTLFTEPLETEFEFEEDIPAVTVKWQTPSNKPILLRSMSINNILTRNTDFYFMNKMFENEDSYTVDRFVEDISSKLKA